MNAIRGKRSQSRYSGADATDYAFNQYAGAAKIMGPVFGVVQKLLGALNAGVQVDQGSLVAVYNNSASTAFVITGLTLPAAPSTGANGIPIPPNSYLIIPMGQTNFIISSAATCFGYQLQDDLTYNANSGANN
jgi:hypothetical protein